MIHHLISCSHATCAIPEAHRTLFESVREEVESPSGWEPGALNLGQAFAMHFRTPLVHGDVSRLLIDLEEDDDQRWSPHSLALPEATRLKLADRHEKPYRTLLRQRIADALQRGAHLLHLLIHTAPGGDGAVDLDIPQDHPLAREIAAACRHRLLEDGIYARLRSPAGESALTHSLSQSYPDPRYAQLRVSVSQSFFLEGKPQKWDFLKKRLLFSMQQACSQTEKTLDATTGHDPGDPP